MNRELAALPALPGPELPALIVHASKKPRGASLNLTVNIRNRNARAA
jgi:hypothetical protein